jgi:hypothetical protein
MHLDIKREDVTAKIGQDPMMNKDLPESMAIVRREFTLPGTGKAIHRVDWMVAQDQLVPRVSMVLQGMVKPSGLDPALPTKTRPESVDEHQQEILVPDKVGETLLARRPILGQVGQDLAEYHLALGIICGVIASCVVQRDRVLVEPGHLMVKPIPPLLSQHLVVSRQAADLIP